MVVRVKVQIGTMVFNGVESVMRKKSIKNYTETATIKLPKKLRFKSNGRPDSMYEPSKTIKDYIKVGDPVTIWMGYDNKLLKRFEGYVARGVEPSVPIVIECEDEMWKLKRKKVSVSSEKTTIKQIMTTIAGEYESDVLDAEIGSFSEKNKTAAQILQVLKERFLVHSFFIGKKLIVGKPFTNDQVKDLPTKTYDFSHNIIESSLKFRSAEDVKLKVTAISIQPDNSKIEQIVGDTDGESRSLHYFDVSKKELKKLAERDLQKFKVDGYEGDIKSFGFPIVEVGQRIKIVDKGYDKRNSEHYAEAIEETIDRGYRLKITVGEKVN